QWLLLGVQRSESSKTASGRIAVPEERLPFPEQSAVRTCFYGSQAKGQNAAAGIRLAGTTTPRNPRREPFQIPVLLAEIATVQSSISQELRRSGRDISR